MLAFNTYIPNNLDSQLHKDLAVYLSAIKKKKKNHFSPFFLQLCRLVVQLSVLLP